MKVEGDPNESPDDEFTSAYKQSQHTLKKVFKKNKISEHFDEYLKRNHFDESDFLTLEDFEKLGNFNILNDFMFFLFGIKLENS